MRSSLVRATGGIAVVGLIAVTAAAETARGYPIDRVVVDVGAGAALALAAALDRRTPRRWLLLVAAVTWLAGGVLAPAVNLHRGALAVAFGWPVPTTARRGTRRVVLLAAAATLCLAGLGPIPAALLFTVAALAGATRRSPLLALAAVELSAAVIDRQVGADAAVLTYSLAVATVTLTTVVGERSLRHELVDQAARGEDDDVFTGLTSGLREATGDGRLEVVAAATAATTGRIVSVDGVPWARVTTSARWLDDPVTWRDLSDAVTLVGRRQLALERERARAAELASSRSRLLDAADQQRAIVGPALVRDVIAPLRRAAALATRWPSAAELAGAADDAELLLHALPPLPLGGGALDAALDSLAARTPGLTTRAALDAPTDTEAETVAYAVCCEAVANALKHAAGSPIAVEVRTDAADLVVEVSDPGPGGAVPTGPGLRGLVDRVEARGGTLTITSAPAHGTTVAARLPRQSIRTNG